MPALELPIPIFDDRKWVIAHLQEVSPITIAEYIPEGTAIDSWSELLTVSSVQGEILHASLIDALERKNIEDRIINGRFEWRILRESSTELVYEWTIEDDVVIGDHYEAVRVFQGNSALHSVHYAVRNSPVKWDVRRDWIPRLEATHAERQPGVTFSVDHYTVRKRDHELGSLLNLVEGKAGASDARERLSLCRRALALVDINSRLDLWAGLQLTIGITALQLGTNRPRFQTEETEKGKTTYQVGFGKDLPPGEETVDFVELATTALRKALCYVTWSQMPMLRAIALRQLSAALLANGGAKEGAAAIAVCQHAIQHIERTSSPIEWAIGQFVLAKAYLAQGMPDRGGNAQLALDAFNAALEVLRKETTPGEWAEAMCGMGDAYLRLGGKRYRDMARQLYSQVQEAIFSESAFEALPPEVLASLVQTVGRELVDMDPNLGGDVIVPSDYSTRDRKAKILYLRSFETRPLMLGNRFSHPEALEIRYEKEPENLSIEAVLYRTLGSDFYFTAHGGTPDIYGGGRTLFPGGSHWRRFTEGAIDSMDLIVIVPGESPGIRWELETIVRRGAIMKCLFVMPPLSPDANVRAMWAEATNAASDYGLTLPPFDEEGALFRLKPDGSVAEVWGFDVVWSAKLPRYVEQLISEHNVELRNAVDGEANP